MKTFYLKRVVDQSGISGTGIVAQGVIFDNGKCAMAWLTKHSSIAIYDNIKTLKAIHGHGGQTLIVVAEGNCLGCGHPLEDHWGEGCGACMWNGVTPKNPENAPKPCFCALMNHPEFLPPEPKKKTRKKKKERK